MSEARKQGGASGILPEMVKAACFLTRLVELVQAMRRSSRVPADWRDAVWCQ